MCMLIQMDMHNMQIIALAKTKGHTKTTRLRDRGDLCSSPRPHSRTLFCLFVSPKSRIGLPSSSSGLSPGVDHSFHLRAKALEMDSLTAMEHNVMLLMPCLCGFETLLAQPLIAKRSKHQDVLLAGESMSQESDCLFPLLTTRENSIDSANESKLGQ